MELLAKQRGHEAQAILPILQSLDQQESPLSQAVLGALADVTKSPDSKISGLASFYSMLRPSENHNKQIRICDGPVCSLYGADKVLSAVEKTFAANSDWCVERTSCLGLCDRAPAALVAGEACGPVPACNASALLQGLRGTNLSYAKPLPGETRVVMKRIGCVKPESLDSALEAGAYQALRKALQNPSEAILDEVEASGLTGRGGAGFPTGRKWRMVADSEAEKKYIICNADESEPGAFKDRVLLEGDPHLILEGMALAAFAVGANEGIVYVRGEYQQSAKLVERAIQQAEDANWLGEQVNGTRFSFHVRVHYGAGAYICGEETALLE
ncbi:MAG: NAD(P)H-dependent oxidoreductase subunit E, partial [Pseudomonadales bacterium]